MIPDPSQFPPPPRQPPSPPVQPGRPVGKRRILLVAGVVLGVGLGFAALQMEGLRALFGLGPHAETARYTESRTDGVMLIDRFRSYQDLARVRALLAESGHEDVELSRRGHPASRHYPALERAILVVGAYEHLGSAGRLSLGFLNDRLYQAEFEPASASEYAAALRRRGLRPRAADNARIEVVTGELRIHGTVALAATPMGLQLRTRPWMIWEDRRLVAQRDEWDARYGQVPKGLTSSSE